MKYVFIFISDEERSLVYLLKQQQKENIDDLLIVANWFITDCFIIYRGTLVVYGKSMVLNN